jgi:hypothetical protein
VTKYSELSQPPQPTANERRERANGEPKCTALLPNWKHGIACSRSIDKDGDLYGNGVPIVPNVHAVMVWATSIWSAMRHKQ